MRIPHHLTRSATGLWSFRQRVPADLQDLVGRRLLKRTLRTNDLGEARLRAILLASRYAQAFTSLRDRRMDKLGKKEVDELIARLTQTEGLKDLTLHRTKAPDGTVSERWQIDNEDDLRLFQQAHQSNDPLLDAVNSPLPAREFAAARAKITPITLADARDAWLATLQSSTLPKTLTIKKTAVEALVRFLGNKTKLHTVTRTDLARWYQHMRDEGASTPTLTNKQSYVGGRSGFFEWAQASGYFPKGDNPAAGHVSYSIREKRARRKFGFKAYDAHQIQALFAPAAFESLALSARWAAVIGLYTGARASEVGQLLVADVIEEDGLLCIRVSDEGEYQKVKTEVSLRTVPVHPDLLALGFREWVDGLRAAGTERLFPAAKADAKNGAGNWITKAFGRHLEQVGKSWPAGKRGFHSLRKTVIQALQGAGVPSELRAQLVGHELDDEHHSTYSRDFTVREKLHGPGPSTPGLTALSFGLNLPVLAQLLLDTAPTPRAGRKRVSEK
ncbi:site-specific integrase [Pseudoxanthomonas putridarboris]|uniref:Site-specific integrase n=1 Tax=Pseudoxanthomonas putridarboris TaxID=752605 RepID=A0ABU9J1Y1_9GAMM